jgi:hypothetical protein
MADVGNMAATMNTRIVTASLCIEKRHWNLFVKQRLHHLALVFEEGKEKLIDGKSFRRHRRLFERPRGHR